MAFFAEKDDYIEEIARNFFLEAGQVRDLDALIKAVVSSFNIIDGKFEPIAGTTEIRLRLNQIMNAYLSGTDPEYLSAIENFLSEFNGIEEFNFELHQELNDIEVQPETLTDAKSQAISNVTWNLSGNPYDVFYKNKVREGLVNFVTQGQSISQMEEWLSHKVSYPSYAKYASFNGAMQYDGDIQRQIAQTYGLNGIRYVGSIIRDSRPQCRRWVRKREISLQELPRELEWMRQNGEGQIAGTNTENFLRNRGGHNCRHQAFPVVFNPN